MIKLGSVYETDFAETALFDILKERTPEQSISHKEMPTFEQHVSFIKSKPYEAWYFIFDSFEGSGYSIIGSCYLTHQREIGLFIFNSHQHKGYGAQALAELRRLHPGRLLANVNPANTASRAFFEKHGGKLIQVTRAFCEKHGRNEFIQVTYELP